MFAFRQTFGVNNKKKKTPISIWYFFGYICQSLQCYVTEIFTVPGYQDVFIKPHRICTVYKHCYQRPKWRQPENKSLIKTDDGHGQAGMVVKLGEVGNKACVGGKEKRCRRAARHTANLRLAVKIQQNAVYRLKETIIIL